MAPSPAMRRSPGRELRVDNHKRGRSLEGGILFREKDEDLALFNEVQSRETDNFLLQLNDDVEDIFSTKLRYFSDHKLGISIPIRGESSDLLNADGGKNDYDWLLTPPETPLFTSLDDETPPVNLAQRGRPRSQPISISRSSTHMEKSHRSSKGSASPNKLSPSPRFGNITVQARGRTSSTPHSSPTPSLHHATPLRRSSPPPNKPSPPAQRSLTPTPRRVSTSSIGNVTSSGLRGTSPVKTSRGNSASPKVRAWQSNITGFSSEAPPNLRTSLADRPASYVRGSSPSSRNGRDSSSKSGRQAMSPTASRSVSSSHSHDRDRFSSHGKYSIVSSGDYDVDSLLSIPVGSSDRSSTRRFGSLPNNRAPTFSKKPSRTVASSSAPKRSIELALRQTDHRKSSQNMFRPLLSSVPSSTLYVGKSSAVQHAIISRNSSVTTTSNASSDQATTGAHDTEGSELNQEDVTSAYVKGPYLDAQDEVFAFEKADALNENIGHRTQDGSLSSQHGDLGGGSAVDYRMNGFENLSDHDTAMETVKTSEVLYIKGVSLDVKGAEDMVLCPNCGRMYCTIESTERELKLCPDCCRSDALLMINNAVTATTVEENSPSVSTMILEEPNSFDVMDPPIAEPESLSVTSMAESRIGQQEKIVSLNQTSYSESIWNFLSTDSLSRTVVEEGDQRHANRQVVGQPTVNYSVPDGDSGSQKMQQSLEYPSIKLVASEGTGISVLLTRSSSGKGAVLQSRSFTASSISYDDPSYVRDSACSLRSSYGHGSASTSSSVDFSSYRQTDAHFQRQSSGRKSDFENYRYDLNTKHRRTGSSLSGTSSHAFQPLGLATSMHEECYDSSLSQVQTDVGVRLIATQELLLSSENMEEDDACSDVENNYMCRTMDASTSESSNHILNMNPEVSPVASFSNSDEPASHENGLDLTNNRKNMDDVEASAISPEFSIVVEENMPSSCVDSMNIAEVPTHSTLENISEAEIVNAHQGSIGAQSDLVSSSSKGSIDGLCEPHIAATSDKDITTSLVESDISDHEHGTVDESTVTVGGKGGSKARSLTLEEATDTILFCSSIIHKIANDAATIAIEKENPVTLEGSRPMVTILGKANPERKDPRGRTAVKHAVKSPKARRVETEEKPPYSSKIDENTDVSTTRIVGVYNNDSCIKAPPKLESKCNCTIM